MSFTRRSFFRSAGGLIASVAIAQGIVRKLFDSVTLAAAQPTHLVNPAWVDAPYEVVFEFQWANIIRSAEFPPGMGNTIRGVR